MTPAQMTWKSTSGSPPTGEPEYLLVGQLRRPYGLRGQLVMEVVTDFPERLKQGIQVFVGDRFAACKIVETKAHAHGMLILFEGVDNPEKAARLRNMPVYVSTVDRPPLPEGQYYHHQLIGLQVVDEGDKVLGQLMELLHTGANDVYVVQTAEHTELLLPAIDSVVMSIDIAAGKIRVHIPDGLVPEPRIHRRGRGARKNPNAKPG